MSNRTEADRRRTQRFTVEAVLIPHINKILDRDLIFAISQEMEEEFTNGSTAWAFKGNAQESLLADELARLKTALAAIEIAYKGMQERAEKAEAIVDKPMAFGPMAFEFYSFSTWVNKAQTWFPAHGLSSKNCVCLDAKGRICRIGRDFMQARDEEAFPVTVHPYRPSGEPT